MPNIFALSFISITLATNQKEKSPKRWVLGSVCQAKASVKGDNVTKKRRR